MGSRTALICETYRHSEQKQSRKFCRSKEDKNGETHPVWAEKGETGCVLGAGEGSSGWRRMKPGEKTKVDLKKGEQLLHNMVEMEGRTCLACRLGQLAAERHWRSLAPRHAPRAEASTPVTTKKERQADACLSFLAGAEGLEPSARGFGVDVGKRTGNGEGARWRRFPSQAIKRRCWFGAAKKPGQKREGKPSLGHLKIFALLTNSKQREKMV